MIAEAWDAAGLYQVGSFVGDNWRGWNGRFRDDVRSFFRSEDDSLRHFAYRVVGSSEIYRSEEHEAEQSVNFVTCHDGFTLNDLVSFSRKHNEANGEGNRDGADDNRSCNCGIEGPTDALSAELPCENLLVYIISNTYWEQLDFELTVIAKGKTFWRRWINTYLDSPEDIVEW